MAAIPGVNVMGPNEWAVVNAYAAQVPRHGEVPIKLVDFIWEVESNKSLKGTMRGTSGEVGPMQINPHIMRQAGAAAEFDYAGPYELAAATEHLEVLLNNFKRGTAYLSRWYNYFKKRTDLETAGLLAVLAYRSPRETLDWFATGFKAPLTETSRQRGRKYDKRFSVSVYKNRSGEKTLPERLAGAAGRAAKPAVAGVAALGVLALVLLFAFRR